MGNGGAMPLPPGSGLKPATLRVDLGASGASTSSSLHRSGSLAHPTTSGKRFRCLGKDCCECNCFVCYLMLGMLGFVAFWSLLMLRIYLPERYWEWSYIWRS